MLNPYDFRGEIGEYLPRGAFLRRDRGEYLYITNAPLCPTYDGRRVAALADIGYLLHTDGNMLHILPNAEKLLAIEEIYAIPPNAFCESALRFRGMRADEECLRIFAQGVKAYETGEGAWQYNRMVREYAAKTLRRRCGGGGLYAMAIFLPQMS